MDVDSLESPRSNAAAISTWPLTPCSRKIATRGLNPNVLTAHGSRTLASLALRPGARPVEARCLLFAPPGGVITGRSCIANVVSDHALRRIDQREIEQTRDARLPVPLPVTEA